MCRSIKTLRTGPEVATPREIEAAALQFVRKISGFQRPTARHEAAFYAAVEEIAQASEKLLDAVSTTLSASGRAS